MNLYSCAQKVVLLKELEGYSLVECEQESGSAVRSSGGDSLTVETSLEDIEFGFSVVRSIQKVKCSILPSQGNHFSGIVYSGYV